MTFTHNLWVLTGYLKVLFHKILHVHLRKFLPFEGLVKAWASIGGVLITFLIGSLCLPPTVK